jgi:hypothetical protein
VSPWPVTDSRCWQAQAELRQQIKAKRNATVELDQSLRRAAETHKQVRFSLFLFVSCSVAFYLHALVPSRVLALTRSRCQLVSADAVALEHRQREIITRADRANQDLLGAVEQLRAKTQLFSSAGPLSPNTAAVVRAIEQEIRVLEVCVATLFPLVSLSVLLL